MPYVIVIAILQGLGVNQTIGTNPKRKQIDDHHQNTSEPRQAESSAQATYPEDRSGFFVKCLTKSPVLICHFQIPVPNPMGSVSKTTQVLPRTKCQHSKNCRKPCPEE
jgi:hypothetical protein